MLKEISEYSVFSQFSDKRFNQAINSIECDSIEKRFALGCTDNGYYFVYDSFCSALRICNKTRHTQVLTDARWMKNDNMHFCVASMNQNLFLYDVNSSETPTTTYNTTSNVHSCSVNCKFPIIACALQDGFIRLYDLRESVNLHSLDTSHEADVKTVEWSPDSEYLIACGDTEGNLLLFDIRNGKKPYQYGWWRLKIGDDSDSIAHETSIVGLSFSPNGRTMYSLDDGGLLRQWNVDSGLSTAVEYKLDFTSKRNRRIGFCIFDKEDIFVPVENTILSIAKREKMIGHLKPVTAVAKSADGIISVALDQYLCVWKKTNDIHIENDASDWSD